MKTTKYIGGQLHLKVWIDDTVVYHSKNGQKATLSFMNKLGDISKTE